MKRLLALLLALTLMACAPVPRQAEQMCPCDDTTGEEAFDLALSAMRRMDGLRLPSELELHPAYFHPGVATAERHGPEHTEIVFDRLFLEMADDRFGPGAPVGIMAHELSHAADFADGTFLRLTPQEQELRADNRAGCALALLGCHMNGYAGMLLSVVSNPDGEHPEAEARVGAIIAGYDRCAAR